MRAKAIWTLLALVVAMMLASAGLAAVGRGARAQTEPRLSLLDIAVWPEFDRPLVLVIIQAELSADTTLPAPLTLRIPAIAGQPYAVAPAASPPSSQVPASADPPNSALNSPAFSPTAPQIAGMDSKNENRAAVSRSTPLRIPAEIVDPDRDRPG